MVDASPSAVRVSTVLKDRRARCGGSACGTPSLHFPGTTSPRTKLKAAGANDASSKQGILPTDVLVLAHQRAPGVSSYQFDHGLSSTRRTASESASGRRGATPPSLPTDHSCRSARLAVTRGVPYKSAHRLVAARGQITALQERPERRNGAASFTKKERAEERDAGRDRVRVGLTGDGAHVHAWDTQR